MLAERGIDVSYERVRRWDLKYGANAPGDLLAFRPRQSTLAAADMARWDALAAQHRAATPAWAS